MIEGRVFDSQTKLPVPFCHVYVSDKSGDPPSGIAEVATTTDYDGKYSLPFEGAGYLATSHIEYERQVLKIPLVQGIAGGSVPNQTIDFHLKKKAYQLSVVNIVDSMPSIWQKYKTLIMISVLLILAISYFMIREKVFTS